MTQLSREVKAIIAFLDDSGLPHKVTATLGRYVSISNPCAPHTARSNHCAAGTDGKGLAVDVAGVTPGTSPAAVAQMTAVYNALKPVAAQLSELFFNAPGVTQVVKNGRWRNGLETLGAATWTAHRNHIHIAVPKGTFIAWPAPPPQTGAAGSGPPTIRSTEFPQGETMLTRHDVNIPALDGQGRGWVELDVPAANLVSIVCNGPYPPVDGYWEMPVVSRQDRGGKTIVAITEGQPNSPLLLSVWVTGA